jgi:chromate transport protein ChrA
MNTSTGIFALAGALIVALVVLIVMGYGDSDGTQNIIMWLALMLNVILFGAAASKTQTSKPNGENNNGNTNSHTHSNDNGNGNPKQP